MTTAAGPSRRGRKRYLDVLAACVILLFVVCWFIGASRPGTEIDGFLRRAWPAPVEWTQVDDATWRAEGDGAVLGYARTGTASGYGGPLTVGVAVEPNGEVQSLALLAHRETPSFFDRALSGRILARLVQVGHDDPIELDGDIDGVSGATYTSRGLVQAVQRAVHGVAREQLGLDVAAADQAIVFGLPEIVLLILLGIAVGSRFIRKNRKLVQALRWTTLIGGLVFLGFAFNGPFTLGHLNMLMVGYWPEWRTHLYWFILVFGLLLFKATQEWNVYCYNFCPFGAAQEVLGKIGNAKPRPVRAKTTLLWLQRGLTIGAICIALLFVNPGLSSFEVFGTLFELNGSDYQFVLLAIVLLLSIFVYRPWCRHLCPLHQNATEGLFEWCRRQVIWLWKKVLPRRTPAA